jgi:hypothetical protein
MQTTPPPPPPPAGRYAMGCWTPGAPIHLQVIRCSKCVARQLWAGTTDLQDTSAAAVGAAGTVDAGAVIAVLSEASLADQPIAYATCPQQHRNVQKLAGASGAQHQPAQPHLVLWVRQTVGQMMND